jgi:hypothetical protein
MSENYSDQPMRDPSRIREEPPETERDEDRPAPPKLGSLAQGARMKQLNTARGILIVLGLLILGLNIVLFFMIPSMVDGQIEREIGKLRGQGAFQVNQAAVADARSQMIHLNYLLRGVFIAAGVVLLACGLLIRTFPVPATILSLILYIGAVATSLLMSGGENINPASLVIPVLIILALVRAVQAAVAYERERREQADAEAGY